MESFVGKQLPKYHLPWSQYMIIKFFSFLCCGAAVGKAHVMLAPDIILFKLKSKQFQLPMHITILISEYYYHGLVREKKHKTSM